MFELKYFISNLINDTKSGAIQWTSVCEMWKEDYRSIDFRNINPPLENWTGLNPFTFKKWDEALISNVGFYILLSSPSRFLSSSSSASHQSLPAPAGRS